MLNLEPRQDVVAEVLVQAVQKALDDKIKSIVEEEAAEAGKRAVSRVRELATTIAANVRAKADIHFPHGSRELRIILRME